MRFNAATRTRVLADMTLDIDPAGTTVEVKVDDTWHPAEWQGAPVNAAGKWKQTARTTTYFAGPDATPAAAVVLTAGKHSTKTRVTSGSDVLVAEADYIDVR